ncbi:hypothetical protein [Aureimonas populi]|uniref:Cyclophilin-like domain-containing protein n=1 Tax=Aureimonas populi TaxID=1701758 RepID=A0ABW5CFA0_9HYPH|nr:hypothetical protein [Aureimonas populi]
MKITQPAAERRITPSHYTTFYILLENVSGSTVDAISVILDEIRVSKQKHGTRINERFVSDRGDVFSLRPGERAWVTIAQDETKFGIGPLSSGRELRSWGSFENYYVADSIIFASVVTGKHKKLPLMLTCREDLGAHLAKIDGAQKPQPDRAS